MLTASLLRQASRAHALMGCRRGMSGINLQDLAAAAALDAKQQGKRGAGGAGGAGPRLPYLAIIPRTNVELEDPTLPPRPPARRPYPVVDPLTPTGKAAELRTLPAILRTQFTTGTAMFARDRMHLVPVTLLGGTPARKGHNPLHLMLDRRDVERELKEAGVFARQFKFDIQADPGVTTPAQLSAVRAAELHTTATLRTVDMQPVEHSCLSAVFGRFVPGKNVMIKVPIKFVNAGACVGVKKGGILIYVRHYLECIFRGDAIPNFDDIAITVDLQTLEVGKRLRMSNVKLGPGLKPLKPKSNVIFVTCKKITAELGAKAEEE